MKKGFTLIELLIVIGILAILATVVVLVLNPAQILAQARDSQRMSDLGSVKSAIGLWLATTTSTPTFVNGTGGIGRSTATTTCGFVTTTCELNSTTTVSSAGWVGVNLSQTTGGSALSSLPLDPTHPGTAFNYAYKGDDGNKTFELNGILESTKYIPLMSTDGGDRTTYYEIGTAPGLAL